MLILSLYLAMKEVLEPASIIFITVWTLLAYLVGESQTKRVLLFIAIYVYVEMVNYFTEHTKKPRVSPHLKMKKLRLGFICMVAYMRQNQA